MIKLYLANTQNAAIESAVDALGKSLAEGSRHIVIVPDSYTYSVERFIFERLGLEGSFSLEVTSFARLAAKSLGTGFPECLSKVGATLVFRKIINRCKDKLVRYGSVAKKAGFAHEMYAVISSLRNGGLSPEALEETIPTLPAATAAKTKDIALLYREYIGELGAKYSDGTSRLNIFAERLAADKSIKESRVYLLGFDSFSAVQYKIIHALAKSAAELSLALTPTNKGKNSALYPSFSYERIKELAEEEGIPLEESETFALIPAPFDLINRALFTYGTAEKRKNEGGKLTVYREPNVYEELNGVAAEIARLVRREGYRYSDIAIVSASDEFDSELESVLSRYGIAHFLDIKYPLSDSLVYKYLSAVLLVARSGFRAERVTTLVKNPLFSAEGDPFGFENYVLAQNINRDAFRSPFREGEFEEIRKEVLRLAKSFEDGERPVGETAEKLLSLLNESLADRLAAAVSELDANTRESNLKALDTLKSVLEELKELFGDESETLASFIALFSATAASISVSLIPRYIDSVFVGKLRSSCILKARAIFVINASSDNFPAPHTYRSIISERDAGVLEAGGIRLYPTPKSESDEEKFAFLDLASKPERLYFGGFVLTPTGEQRSPSPVADELTALIDTVTVSLSERFSLPRAKTVEDVQNAAVTRENAFFMFLKNLNSPPVSPDPKSEYARRDLLFAALSDEDKRRFGEITRSPEREEGFDYAGAFFGSGRTSSVSEFECYFGCPYRHFLQYGARLRERPDGKPRPLDMGIIIHRAFELYLKEVKDIFRTTPDEKLRARAEEAARQAFAEADPAFSVSPANQKNLARIRADVVEALCQTAANLKLGAFKPVFIEYSFGFGGEAPAITLETSFGAVILRGKIDRADLSDDGYIAVVDLKTGGAATDLGLVYTGQKVQLYVYLTALKSLGNYKAAGVFNLPLPDGYTKKGKTFGYEGQILDEPGNLDRFERGSEVKGINSAYREAYQMRFLPVTLYGKGGELKPKTGDFLSGAQFEAVEKYVGKLLSSAAEEIASGITLKLPVDGTCEYCPYLPVCGKEPSETRVKPAVEIASFYTEGEK